METATEELKIKKINLKDNVLVLEYDEIIQNEEEGPVINTIKRRGGHPPHKDLKEALAALAFHMAMRCEQIEPASSRSMLSAKNMDVVNAIAITGLSIGGSDENEGVVLIGGRSLKSGEVFNMVSPFTKWGGEYKYAADLEPEVGVVLNEALLYLGGKYAPNPQLELELDKEKAA